MYLIKKPSLYLWFLIIFLQFSFAHRFARRPRGGKKKIYIFIYVYVCQDQIMHIHFLTFLCWGEAAWTCLLFHRDALLKIHTAAHIRTWKLPNGPQTPHCWSQREKNCCSIKAPCNVFYLCWEDTPGLWTGLSRPLRRCSNVAFQCTEIPFVDLLYVEELELCW